MKHQALFPLKDNSKKLKCRLLQFLFGALRVNIAAKETQYSNSEVLVMDLTTVCICILNFYHAPVYS